MNTDRARMIITGVVLALFTFAYAQDPGDEMMTGALISSFSLAISYWLGSSKGSSDKTKQLAEIASETPQPVEVVNTAEKPAIVTEAPAVAPEGDQGLPESLR